MVWNLTKNGLENLESQEISFSDVAGHPDYNLSRYFLF